MGFFDRIKKIGIFSGFSKLDDSFYDELEESLILADMGMDTTLKAVDELRRRTRERRIKDVEGARACMKEILAASIWIPPPRWCCSSESTGWARPPPSAKSATT